MSLETRAMLYVKFLGLGGLIGICIMVAAYRHIWEHGPASYGLIWGAIVAIITCVCRFDESRRLETLLLGIRTAVPVGLGVFLPFSFVHLLF